jgi:hypothetical protein
MKTPHMFLVLIAFFAFVAEVALAQPSPPTSGIQLSGRSDLDLRFPITVSQCEAAFIYYDASSIGNKISFYRPDVSNPRVQDIFLSILVPRGTGYLEWICDIPADHTFFVAITYGYYVVVNPGSSSCLQNITATYSDADYNTTLFVSYTANSPVATVTTAPGPIAKYAVSNSSVSCDSSFTSSTLPLPTGSFSTITVK